MAESANAHLGFFLPDVEMGAWLGKLGPALDFSLAEPALAAADLRWFWLGRGWIAF